MSWCLLRIRRRFDQCFGPFQDDENILINSLCELSCPA